MIFHNLVRAEFWMLVICVVGCVVDCYTGIRHRWLTGMCLFSAVGVMVNGIVIGFFMLAS